MSSYNARRAPNVSQYLANLNTIPSAQELAAHQQNQLEFNETDLDFLTNAEFFDFDQFNPVPPAGGPLPGDGAVEGVKGQGMGGTTQYPQFTEFQTYPPTVASTPSNLYGTHHNSPNTGVPFNTTPPQVGDKRKPSAADLEEQSRLAAEEDKRRRNTAASARFRVKKKQREQALEKQAKEMADKVSLLEGKVQQLEMENKWLKGLITEKGGSIEGKGKMGEGLAKGEEKEAEERSTEIKKRGIGTEDAVDDDQDEE